MTLTVGNIANDPSFDSAISVEDADAYHALRGNAAWQPLQTEIKEQLLRKATDYLRATYGMVWARWVRISLTVPVAMANAVAELALISKTTPLLTNITRGKKRVTVGPITVEYDGNSNTQTQFILVCRMLACLLDDIATGGVMVRLVRC